MGQETPGQSPPDSLSFPRIFTIDGSRWRYFAAIGLTAAVYFGAGKFGLSLASVHTNVSPVWPPTGLALAAVLLFGFRVWPGIFLGALLVNLTTPIPVAAAVAIAAGNTVEALAAVAALRAFGFRKSLDRARDVFKFVSAVLICTTISATIGNLSLCLWHAAEWNQFPLLWLTWWLGDLTGAVTVTPLVLTWLAGAGHWLPRRRYIEATALILLLSVSAIATFGGKSPASLQYYPLSRLLIPFLLWASFRLGRRGVTVAITVVSAFAIWGTSLGNGPFIATTGNESLLILQLFLASNAVTFLALVTVVEERRLAEAERRGDQRRLEANLAVTRILAESPEVDVALQRILATVGEKLKWEFGCVWLPDDEGKVLRCVTTWQPSFKAPRFQQLSRERVFERGAGLPGRVWASLEPAWIRDVAKDDNFPRAAVAIEEGLHAAFAFPILFNQKFLGVIEFFSYELRRSEQPLLAMFAAVGSQLGQFIERKRVEAEAESANLHYRAVVEALPAAVYTTDADGKITMFNQAAVDLSGRVPQVGSDSWCVTWKLYHPDGTPMPHADSPMAMALKKGKAIRGVEAIAERPDGSRISFVPYPTPLRSHSGKLVGAINMLVDITDRKRAEAQLRDREQRLSAFFSTAAVGVAVLTPDARFEQVNDTFCRIVGYSREELTRMDSAALTHPDDNPLMKQKLDSLMSDRIPRFEIEKRYIRKDGAQIWVQNSVSVTRDGANRPLNLVMLCQEITDRKRIEEALRESQHEMRAALDYAEATLRTSPVPLLVLESDLRVHTANEAFYTMFHANVDETEGRFVYDLGDGQWNIPQLRELLEEVLPKHKWFQNFEVTHNFARVGTRTVLLNGRRMENEGSGPERIVLVIQDVTQQKLAEQEFRHLAAIVETTDDAVVSKDLNGIITSWNPAAERLFGYKADEVVGKSITILIPSERSDEEPAILRRLRRGERIDHYETIRMAKDGRRLDVSLTVSPIRDASGKIVGASKIARDITQQKKAQKEIARLLAAERAARQEAEVASRTKDEFLATLSHELRTPLTAMLGWLTILRGHKLDQQTTQHAIETIERNAKAQAQLIEDLVDISRIVGGKLSLEIAPTELFPVIDAAVEVVTPAANAKQISIKVNYDATVGPVSGDAGRMQQIIWNLLSNAVKFTPSGGSVFVDYRRHGAFAEVVVRDTGIGISGDFLPHVFERFRQAESAATRSHRGMGLGLAIVRHLVELHGGTVSVDSAGENQGSTFTVRLPLASVPKPLAASTTLHDQNGDFAKALDGLKILLVEDEADARELIAILLQGSGATVEAVDTVSSALQRLPIFTPDVLVSDIGLPRESGYDLIRQIRALSSEVNKIPAIALTAFATENDRKMSLSAGFQAHLAKPVDPSDLLNTIKIVINSEN